MTEPIGDIISLMSKQIHKPYFRHFVVEINCPFDSGNSVEWLEARAIPLIESLGVDIVAKTKHIFEPQGITLIYVLTSSHMAIHSWPENNFLHVDLIICSEKITSDIFLASIEKIFPGMKYKMAELKY